MNPGGTARRVFTEEARDLLIDLEEALLELESHPGDAALMARVFRALHTLKGTGAMFGFDAVARFTHVVEDLFDSVRKAGMPATSELLALGLDAKDHLQDLLELGASSASAESGISSPAGAAAVAARERELLGRIGGLAARCTPPAAEPAGEEAPHDTADMALSPPGGAGEPPARSGIPAGSPFEPRVYWLRYAPSADALRRGLDPSRLLDGLRGLGALHLWPHCETVPGLDGLDAEAVHLRWDAVLVTEHPVAMVREPFATLMDEAGLEVVALGEERLLPPPELLCRIAAQGAAPRPAPECTPPPGDDAAPAGTLRPGGDEGPTTSLRVDSAKVDRLLDNVGELVILQARLSRIATDHDDPRLRELAEGLDMVPLDATFHAFRRLVRDLAARLGKEVRFVAEGGETELDKTVIDHLRDPLLHLVRNAMDHGVEPAGVRLAAGKPAEAVLRLVSDDGAGIDLDRLRAVGVARGLLAPDAEPGEAELLQLLFLPGFSTASGVSDLSGRGVGLDVVSTALGALRGSVDVVTRRGGGTAWRLRIPLTLAIIDGLRVRVGDEAFILPLTQVEACLERFVDGEAATLGLIEYRERLVPCLSLRRFLDVPGEQPAYERVIIANVDGQPVGFAVDGVAGLEQAVIKRLGGPCRRAAWIAGSSVDAEGGISLILDAAQLVRVAQGMQER